MSQENVEIVREAFESAAPLSDSARLAPDAEFDFTAFPDRPLLQGVDELRAFRDREAFGKSVSFTAERYFDVDDERVLVFVRARAVGAQSGTPVEVAAAHEFTLRHGRIVRMKIHLDRAEALKAPGAGGVSGVAGEYGHDPCGLREVQCHGTDRAAAARTPAPATFTGGGRRAAR